MPNWLGRKTRLTGSRWTVYSISWSHYKSASICWSLWRVGHLLIVLHMISFKFGKWHCMVDDIVHISHMRSACLVPQQWTGSRASALPPHRQLRSGWQWHSKPSTATIASGPSRDTETTRFSQDAAPWTCELPALSLLSCWSVVESLPHPSVSWERRHLSSWCSQIVPKPGFLEETNMSE